MSNRSSLRQWSRFLVDRCRLIATATLVVAVPTLIYAAGTIGFLLLGIVFLASLFWTPRIARGRRRSPFLRVIRDEDPDVSPDTFFRSLGLDVTCRAWLPGVAFDPFEHHTQPRKSDWMDETECHPLGGDPGFPSFPDQSFTVNPASGLPMISGDTSGVDVAGNPFGFSYDHFGSESHSASTHIGPTGIG